MEQQCFPSYLPGTLSACVHAACTSTALELLSVATPATCLFVAGPCSAACLIAALCYFPILQVAEVSGEKIHRMQWPPVVPLAEEHATAFSHSFEELQPGGIA